MKRKFEVTVARTEYQAKVVTVEADSVEEAEALAMKDTEPFKCVEAEVFLNGTDEIKTLSDENV